MPKLEVEDVGTYDVEEGKRLVLAIEEDAGVDILHRCGSCAACTTCRNPFGSHRLRWPGLLRRRITVTEK